METYEEFYLLGYNAVYSAEYQPSFQRNISPPSSGLENKQKKKKKRNPRKSGSKQSFTLVS
jgi:hypothetical protein